MMMKTKQKEGEKEEKAGAEAVAQTTKLPKAATQFAHVTKGGAMGGGFMRQKKEKEEGRRRK